MPEQHNIEYKINWHENYLKWICGFANSKGGKLYIGIDDNEKILGISNYKELMEQLPNKFSDILGVYAEINLHNEEEKYYLEIIVPRYDVPISLRGKYYIRTGSTLQELAGLALNEFILKRTGKIWDDIPEQRATIEDIDKQSIKQFIEDAGKANRVNIETNIKPNDLLDKLRLTDDGNLKRGALILYVKEKGSINNSLYQELNDVGKTTATVELQELVQKGILLQTGTKGRGIKYAIS